MLNNHDHLLTIELKTGFDNREKFIIDCARLILQPSSYHVVCGWIWRRRTLSKPSSQVVGIGAI